MEWEKREQAPMGEGTQGGRAAGRRWKKLRKKPELEKGVVSQAGLRRKGETVPFLWGKTTAGSARAPIQGTTAHIQEKGGLIIHYWELAEKGSWGERNATVTNPGKKRSNRGPESRK